jgi:hypothetical protein
MTRFFFASVAGGAIGRWLWMAGAEVANWSDADQVDYLFIPLLACVLPYTVVASVLLALVGNGWLRASSNAPSSSSSSNNSNTKEG